LNFEESSLSWTVVKDDGTVNDLTPSELKPGQIFQESLAVTAQDVFPAPFLLFNKDDIA